MALSRPLKNILLEVPATLSTVKHCMKIEIFPLDSFKKCGQIRKNSPIIHICKKIIENKNHFVE